jgi:hypothetical protein
VPALTDEPAPEAPHRPQSPLETTEDTFTWLVTGPAPLAVNGCLLPLRGEPMKAGCLAQEHAFGPL